MSQKRAKPKHLKDKSYKRLLKVLAIALFMFSVLPMPERLRSLLTEMFDKEIENLKNFDSIADSENSHKPATKDIQPAKKKEKSTNGKQGGQPGHDGKTLPQVDNPNKREYLVKDREKYIKDPRYKLKSTQKRQIIEVECKKIVIEFVNEVFVDTVTGQEITGEFPEGESVPVQYGKSVEILAAHLNVNQFLPFERTAEIINALFSLSISPGTICNMVKKVATSPQLKFFQKAAIKDLIESARVNFDETGGKILALLIWIHVAVSNKFTYFFPHKKRGKEAMDAMGILNYFRGFAIHDCWKPYFHFVNCVHCLCNAHIERALKAAAEIGQKWAKAMREFLLSEGLLVDMNGGALSLDDQKWARKEYERVTQIGYRETGGKELARPPGGNGKRGRIAKTKSRNLLERLDFFEDDILRFTTDKDIPFSNNDAERPVRLFKLHFKVSGCFRSEENIENFCQLWSYTESCKKNGIKPLDAIRMLQNGELPEFVLDVLSKTQKKAA